MTATAQSLDDPEVIEVGDGSITLAVIVDRGHLVVVLRARPEPGVVVRIPVALADAEAFTRVLAGSVRYLQPAPTCAACGRHSRPGSDR